MLKKHIVLLGVIVSISLLYLATLHYPGGSLVDKTALGFDWKNNYISNLFGEKAVNGSDNGARYWAIGGMFFLAVSFALFFMEFSKKIPAKGPANVIKYCGISGMICMFLIATPLHDSMVTISSTLFLIGIFYITVFVFKSRLHVFKFMCLVCLLVFYFTLFIYGSGILRMYLPILQKITFAITSLLVIGLEYFTRKEDFQHIKVVK
ncbi:MAG TPA: hypothetical protein VGK10_12140 [Prolixibacteraceae bacterium]|jgi:hypothetical protein